jgi:flagellar motor switch protein FliN/FliY
VSEAIEYEQFEGAGSPPTGAAAAPTVGEADLRRLSDIPMELAVELGRTETTVGETLDLRVGSVVELERDAGAPVDLLVNGTPIARGEVVVIDERYGLRITEILDAQEQPDTGVAGEAEDAASKEEGGQPADGSPAEA